MLGGCFEQVLVGTMRKVVVDFLCRVLHSYKALIQYAEACGGGLVIFRWI